MDHSKQLFFRLIFSFVRTCAFRPVEIHALKIDEASFVEIDGEEVFRSVKRIGSCEGESKNWHGGFHDAAQKPKDTFVWRQKLFDRQICALDNVKLYHNVVSKLRKNHQNIFCAVNYFFKSADKDFQNPNLEREQIFRYVSNGCESCEISVSGVRETMTAHGLRRTVIGRIFECGHAPSAVALRTGHRFLKSLES